MRAQVESALIAMHGKRGIICLAIAKVPTVEYDRRLAAWAAVQKRNAMLGANRREGQAPEAPVVRRFLKTLGAALHSEPMTGSVVDTDRQHPRGHSVRVVFFKKTSGKRA